MASVIGTIIIGSTTQWFLSMNKTMDGTNDRLEAMTIAMSEWQRLEHMSLDELEANRENYKTPYKVGDNFTVGVNLGEQGFFDNGTCNVLTGNYASESPNCFKDTTMTVYNKDGKGLYTTRSLPLSVDGTSFPEGTILPYTGDLAKIPRGWVLCDGTNGTPDLRGRFLEGTGTTTGEFKTAGLPNIKGRFTMSRSNMADNPGYSNGVFKVTQNGITSSYTMDMSGMTVDFDASRSNPVYGRSETVQPPAYTVFYIMKTNTDFHYNHTNPADTPSFYTKDEIDQLLEDERKNVANNYLNKSSKEYVHNDNTNYGLSMAYNPDDKKMHFYVDGAELFAQGDNPSPSLFSDQGGYYEFDNGLIMQWGTSPVYTENNAATAQSQYPHTQLFTKPFPNKCLNVQLSVAPVEYTTNNLYLYDIGGLLLIWNNSSFDWSMQYFYSGTTYYKYKATWFAIGY